MHSGIEMDLYLLNHIVLHDPWVDKEENQPRGNQVADISQALKNSKVKRYTYSEVICFKYFGWSQKKSERYQQFKDHSEQYQEKLDLKKMIINQGHINTISSIYMKPYQIKLVSKMGEFGDDEEALQQDKNLDIDQAVKLLADQRKSEGQTNPLKVKIDSCLAELVDEKIYKNKNQTEENGKKTAYFQEI